jgi:hypothetical protein
MAEDCTKEEDERNQKAVATFATLSSGGLDLALAMKWLRSSRKRTWARWQALAQSDSDSSSDDDDADEKNKSGVCFVYAIVGSQFPILCLFDMQTAKRTLTQRWSLTRVV